MSKLSSATGVGGLGLGGVFGTGGIKTGSAFDTEQQKLWGTGQQYGLSDYLAAQMQEGQGFQTTPFLASTPWRPGENYQWTLPTTPQEQTATSAAMSALQGITPEQAQEIYRQQVLPAQRRMFQEEVLPSIRESYAGSGTFAGSDRAEAEAKAASRFGEAAGQGLADWTKYGMDAARSSIPTALSAAQMEPRRALQEQLLRFEEMKRTDPLASPLIDRILQALQLQSKYALGEQPGPGWGILSSLIGAGGQIGGAVI